MSTQSLPPSPFQVKVFRGAEVLPYLRTVIDLRLKAFCSFPYLYVADVDEELAHTQAYASSPQSLFVIGFRGEKMVGFCSGLPLQMPVSFLRRLCKAFKQEGLKVADYYYFNEIVIAPAFQRHNLGSQLIRRFLQEIQKMNFQGVTGITSIRPHDHPLRPKNYFDTDTIWGKFGFVKIPLICSAPWPTRKLDGSVKVEKNQVACWINNFEI